jgi:hypothetical protein
VAFFASRAGVPSNCDDDRLYPIYQALCRVSAQEEEWIERFRADQKAEMRRDVDGAVGSDVLLDWGSVHTET